MRSTQGSQFFGRIEVVVASPHIDVFGEPLLIVAPVEHPGASEHRSAIGHFLRGVEWRTPSRLPARRAGCCGCSASESSPHIVERWPRWSTARTLASGRYPSEVQVQ